MMKKVKYILFILTFFLIFPFRSYALDTEITLLDIDLKINNDRTINVTEKYKIYFAKDVKEVKRHLDKSIIQVDNTNNKKLINAKITDLKMPNKSKIINKSSYIDYLININGKQDETKEFEISYKYNLGKDINKKIDEIYYNIVSDMDSSISNLTFKIKLPTTFEKNQIHFSIDNNYDLSDDAIVYNIEGNELTGTLNQLLTNKQKLSLYITFPNNFFKGETDNFNYFNVLFLLFPLISLIYSIIIYIKYGKGNKLKVKRTENIPNNFDPAEIGYLFNGKLEEMDLITVIIYLANEGYLKIIEHDDGYKLGKENSFKFVKLKDYDRNNAAQEIIFTNLFRNKDEVELKDIEYHFADTFKEAKKMLDNKDNYNKLFFKNIKTIKLISMILIIISSFMINYKPLNLYTNSILLVILLNFVIFLGIYILFISNTKGLLKIILGGGIIISAIYIGITSTIVQTQLFIIYLIGIIMLGLMCLIYHNLPDRTKYGNKMLGDIYGFKYYLDILNKNEIMKKQEEDSNFYYKMVPYAYVLESLDLWIQKGSDIITPPDWYIPSSEFKMTKFQEFVKNVLYTTALVMMKQVYSQSDLIKYENPATKTNLND